MMAMDDLDLALANEADGFADEAQLERTFAFDRMKRQREIPNRFGTYAVRPARRSIRLGPFVAGPGPVSRIDRPCRRREAGN